MKPYYQDKWVTIYNGDNQFYFDLPNCDLLCTDPPYGIGEAAGKNKTRGQLAQPKDYGNDDWDNSTQPKLLLRWRTKSKYQIIFGGNYYPLPATQCWLIWDKVNSGDFADCELAWTNLKQATRIIHYMWNGMLQQNMKNKEYRYYPTQKPVDVMKWCIVQVKQPIKLIIDPFMGSGSTLVAAKSLNIMSIGIDKKEQACEIAARRCSQDVMELGI